MVTWFLLVYFSGSMFLQLSVFWLPVCFVLCFSGCRFLRLPVRLIVCFSSCLFMSLSVCLVVCFSGICFFYCYVFVSLTVSPVACYLGYVFCLIVYFSGFLLMLPGCLFLRLSVSMIIWLTCFLLLGLSSYSYWFAWLSVSPAVCFCGCQFVRLSVPLVVCSPIFCFCSYLFVWFPVFPVFQLSVFIVTCLSACLFFGVALSNQQ